MQILLGHAEDTENYIFRRNGRGEGKRTETSGVRNCFPWVVSSWGLFPTPSFLHSLARGAEHGSKKEQVHARAPLLGLRLRVLT